jgi:hypothetical protein
LPEEKNENITREGLRNLRGASQIKRSAPAKISTFEKEWRNHQSLSPEYKNLIRKEIGILRNQKTGKEFYDYVTKEMREAPDKEVCARNITDQLMKDPRYIINAATDRDGRRALSILKDDVAGWGNPNIKTIREAMRKEEKQYLALNEKNFAQAFQDYANELKKGVEKQNNYRVDRVYYVSQTYLSDTFYEIRAEIRQMEKHETMKGEIQRAPGPKKDVRVALFDRKRGDFVPDHYMYRKDAPLESTFADSVAEDVLNLGLAAIARAAGRILIEKAGKLVTEGMAKSMARAFASTAGQITEKVVPLRIEKAAVREGVKDVASRARGPARALKRERAQIKVDTEASTERLPLVRKAGTERVRGVSRGKSDSGIDGHAPTETLPKVRGPGGSSIPGGKRPPSAPSIGSGGPPTEQLLPYSKNNIQYLGRDVADKAARMGISEKQLGDLIFQAEARAMMRTQKTVARVWYEVWSVVRPEKFFPRPREAARKSVIRDIENTYSLGVNSARRLIEYGFDPYDISRLIDAKVAEGLTTTEIKQHFATELKLMDYFRDKFAGGSAKTAREMMAPFHSAHGDVIVNIRSEIQGRLVEKFKRQMSVQRPDQMDAAIWDSLPRGLKRQIAWDALPTDAKSRIFTGIAEKANRIAERLLNRVLGSASAAVALPPLALAEKSAPKTKIAESTRTLSVAQVKEVLSFGYSSKDVSRFIVENHGAGYSNIGGAVESQLELLNHLKNDLCGGSMSEAREALEKANFDITKALINKKYSKISSERTTPDPDRKVERMLQDYADAIESTSNLKDSVLRKNLGGKTDTSSFRGLTSEKLRLTPEKARSLPKIRDFKTLKDFGDKGEINKRRYA